MCDYLHIIKKLHNIIFFSFFNVRLIETVMKSILLIEINVTVTRGGLDKFYQTHDLILAFDMRRVK